MTAKVNELPAGGEVTPSDDEYLIAEEHADGGHGGVAARVGVHVVHAK